MAINPITVQTLKVGAIVGHSNGAGWGATDYLFALTGQLYQPAGDWEADPTKAYWKNIYVFTSEQPFPLQVFTGTPPHPHNETAEADIANGEWLEMTIANPQDPSDPHPHPSPYNYANNQGECAPRWLYDYWTKPLTNYPLNPGGLPVMDSPGYTVTGAWFSDQPRSSFCAGVRHGVEIPLMKLYQNYVGQQVGLVKLSVSSTTLQAAESGFPATDWLDPFRIGQHTTPGHPAYVRSAVSTLDKPYYCYWTPSEKADWGLGSERLYADFVRKMNAAKAGLPAGVEMDLDWVVVWFGDNDSNTLPEALAEATFRNYVLAFINRIRSDAVTYGWTKKPAEQLKLLWPKIHPTYAGTSTATYNGPATFNAILDEIAADDEYLTVFDSSAWNTLDDDKAAHGYQEHLFIAASSHYGSSGYDQAAREMIAAIREMDTEPFDALDIANAPTVADIKERVRVYYGRSRGTVDVRDPELLLHINAALFHCYNRAGDQPWWARRRKRFHIDTGPTTVFTFPRYVKRIMRIEAPEDPTYPIRFEMIGHTDNGHLQIQLDERASGTFWVQYITTPSKLTTDAQIVPVPEEVAEWIVVETCRRLAASTSNEPLKAFYAAESMQQQQNAMRHMGQTNRQRRVRLRTQRRMPRLGYRGSAGYRFDGGADG